MVVFAPGVETHRGVFVEAVDEDVDNGVVLAGFGVFVERRTIDTGIEHGTVTVLT